MNQLTKEQIEALEQFGSDELKNKIEDLEDTDHFKWEIIVQEKDPNISDKELGEVMAREILNEDNRDFVDMVNEGKEEIIRILNKEFKGE